jgi:hypothetical protein
LNGGGQRHPPDRFLSGFRASDLIVFAVLHAATIWQWLGFDVGSRLLLTKFVGHIIVPRKSRF